MRCIECGAKLDVTSDPIEMEFRGESLTIQGVSHYRCPNCGEVVFDSAMTSVYEQEVDREYRRICGLLLPEEIKSFRKKLGLTQEQFQVLLGVGKLSVCRWETGRLAQSKTVDNLIRAYMGCPRLVNEAFERAELRPASRSAVAAATPACASLSEYASLSLTLEDAEPDSQVFVVETPLRNEEGLLQKIKDTNWAEIEKRISEKTGLAA